MEDSLERLRLDLAAAGIDPDQVQPASGVHVWDEGTLVCGQEVDGFVVRQLGRGESDDTRELFATEAEALSALRRRLLGTASRPLSTHQRAEIRERMQRRAVEIKAGLRRDRGED